MTKKCNAPGCNTDVNTKLNGKGLSLFPFPIADATRSKRWEQNVNMSVKTDKELINMKVCELHFEADNFASPDKTILTTAAVPTLFGSELSNKRRIKTEEKSGIPGSPPPKQRKLEAAQTPQIHHTSTANANGHKDSDKAEPDTVTKPVREVNRTRNGMECSPFTKQVDMGMKVYRLIIRIDKVIETTEVTEPKIKNLAHTEAGMPNTPHSTEKIDSGDKPCAKVGCKLIKTRLNSKPVFQCQQCSKVYVVKEKGNEPSSWSCNICQEVLSSPALLGKHVREHLTCNICQIQCSTQISFDKHAVLHVSTDPLLPYKCHSCPSTYAGKADVKKHFLEKHVRGFKQIGGLNPKNKERPRQVLFQCEYCYAVFRKEDSYKMHLSMHSGSNGFNCDVCNKTFKTINHLTAHQVKHSNPPKLACQVCKLDFQNVEDLQVHTKTHVEISEKQHKCNVCDKVLQSEGLLNSHMRAHLARAHHCPLCQKAFINKVTLRIHLQTHGKDTSEPIAKNTTEAKTFDCTLCPSKFDNGTLLYNHIMTHLEQMHGKEGMDSIVFEGLDELLGSDDDILS